MKKVLITGASDWLWLALARLYQESGVEVINISRKPCPAWCETIPIEMSDGESIAAAIKAIKEKHGTFDALIHCVGAVHYHAADGIPFDDLTYGLQVNVAGMTALTSWMMDCIKQCDADIMIVSSTLGFKSYTDQAAYTAGARGKRWIAHYFQSELKDTPSRVISFCPGGMQTRFHEKITGKPVDNTQYMPVEWVALCMKQILDLPKYMEVSEIVINRKIASISQ
jgi:3-oxoacyl-[acyl-carrier protein] reductase